jgi:hypothetical protein
MIATQDGVSHIEGTKKSPVERDMNMAEAEETSGMAGDLLGETTSITFMGASEQWKWNKDENRLRSEISESSSAPGDWRSQLVRTIRQQALKVAQLHQTVDKDGKNTRSTRGE